MKNENVDVRKLPGITRSAFTEMPDEQTSEIVDLIKALSPINAKMNKRLASNFDIVCTPETKTYEVLYVLFETIVDETDAVCPRCTSPNYNEGLGDDMLNTLKTGDSTKVINCVLEKIEELQYVPCTECKYLFNM